MAECSRFDGSLLELVRLGQSHPLVISAKKLIDNAVSLVELVVVDGEVIEDRMGSRIKDSTATR